MRVLALYLPDLACELAMLRRESQAGLSQALSLRAPLAVVLAAPGGAELSVGSGGEGPELTGKSVLFAVTERARRLGVHVGQSVASARALSSDLDVRVVTPSELEEALGRIAELMFTLSPTVSLQGPDTVLLDVTGMVGLTALSGGGGGGGREEVLLDEACERVRALGHRVRGAIADGVHTARAVARFAPIPRVVVPAGNDEKALGPLPVAALPVSDEVRSFFGRLGLFTIEDVKKQPLSSLAVRLGDNAPLIIELLHGRDRTPLVPYEAPRAIVEDLAWDEPVAGSEALLFVLRGLLGRVAARLVGRGEATTRLVVRLGLDKGMLRCRQAEQREKNPEITESIDERALEATQELSFVFPVPIAQANELLRAVHTRVERLTLADAGGDARLAAPVLSIAVVADKIVPAARVQLDLSRDTTVSAEALPVLLAELAADLGEDKIGKLSIEPSHLIEERSRLVPFLPDPAAKRALAKKVKQLSLLEEDDDFIAPPTRLLRSPLPVVGNLTVGSFVTLVREKPRVAKSGPRGGEKAGRAERAEKVAIPASFTVKRVQVTERIEDAAWWTGKPRSRDYAVAYLDGDGSDARGAGGTGAGAGGGVEALVVRDRRTGKIAVHGFY
jgi:protein ImuB